ncbi:MAG: CBS domain-containing protein [Lachnospiraceae bacterium]|nr:CBS domain-containing protein [Lachnospiraceae bacterium]
MGDMIKFVSESNITIAEVMQQINNNNGGILFFTNKEHKLVGCITDGDIRRYLLSGGNISDNVFSAANSTPQFATTKAEAKRLYKTNNGKAIPILNETGEIVSIYMGKEMTGAPKNPIRIPVVINAGGKGTRLDPYTRVLPKPLIPVGELPIIELIMKEYQNYDCKDFHIIVNYKRELMKAYFYECDEQYNITWHDEDIPLGTGGGLSLLRGKMNTTFFFANCDALLTSDYEDMLKFHRENGNVITMICAYKNLSIPYGVVEMGKDGVIEKMTEKPSMSFLTNTGIYIVEPEVIDDIEDGEVIGFPDIIEREKAKGKKVAAYPISENDWMDMGQLPELEKMRIKLYGE